MRIKHQELEIDDENPFATCKLDRQKYAEILTSIVGRYADGFVLAINNEWGTGKTTFVKMWQQQLINKDFKTVYFNAWENDFDANPLVALMAELQILTEISTNAVFQSALQKGAILSKSILPGVLKAITKRYVDIQEITDAIENATKATTEILQSEIDEYIKKKESIKEFREKLEDFVKKAAAEKPIIFIIDELDRCRPDYAVEVLEQMKHFFSVPGIVFVLSVDKTHLAASIRGFYGSEQINTDEYLRRFIDLEYSIPQPSAEVFCKYLYEYYEFDDFFKSPERRQYQDLQNDGDNFLRMASLLFRNSNSTLRQIEKIFGQSRLILNSFRVNEYTLSDALFISVYFAVKKPDFYVKLKNGHMSLQELSDGYSALVPWDERINRYLMLKLKQLLILFNNEFGNERTKLVTKDTDGNSTTSIQLNSDIAGDGDLGEALTWVFQGSFNESQTKLSYLTNRIGLTEPLIF